jgi:hypothetical protein
MIEKVVEQVIKHGVAFRKFGLLVQVLANDCYNG